MLAYSFSASVPDPHGGAWCHAGRHCTGGGESSTSWSTGNREEREPWGLAWAPDTSNPTLSDRLSQTRPYLLQQMSSPQVLKCMSYWGPFLFKLPRPTNTHCHYHAPHVIFLVLFIEPSIFHAPHVNLLAILPSLFHIRIIDWLKCTSSFFHLVSPFLYVMNLCNFLKNKFHFQFLLCVQPGFRLIPVPGRTHSHMLTYTHWHNRSRFPYVPCRKFEIHPRSLNVNISALCLHGSSLGSCAHRSSS